eukprot:TRINITY_DN15221_c0_g1_i8.p4 TRINITY_DN15221_c0_g1~~TRINITY_DN15221_c0_g1_i8.p4  ORF type:complete len:169 (+),score=13.76 TRINITY_DN15221_c0_g1_i8:110-616(+)
MERRLCKTHHNRPLDSFCWTCQSLICSYCMQDHNAHNHRTYLLQRLSLPQLKKVRKSPSPQESLNIPPTNKIPKLPKPPVKEVAGDPCICCATPVTSKDVQLCCQHWAHRNCLKELIQKVNRKKGLLFDVVCVRCSDSIDYTVVEATDPQSAIELSLRTAIGDDAGNY